MKSKLNPFIRNLLAVSTFAFAGAAHADDYTTDSRWGQVGAPGAHALPDFEFASGGAIQGRARYGFPRAAQLLAQHPDHQLPGVARQETPENLKSAGG